MLYTIKTIRGRVVLETDDIEEARSAIEGTRYYIDYDETAVTELNDKDKTLTYEILSTVIGAGGLILYRLVRSDGKKFSVNRCGLGQLKKEARITADKRGGK